MDAKLRLILDKIKENGESDLEAALELLTEEERRYFWDSLT